MIPPYLGLALFAEGVSDHRFMRALIPRVVEQIVSDCGHQVVLGNMDLLPAPANEESPRRDERIAQRALAGSGTFHLLFVHADGGGNPARAKQELVQPGLSLAAERLGRSHRAYVPVVPVREMEAWAIADGEAVRDAVGSGLSVAELGLPSDPSAVSRVQDPKATLDEAIKIARAGRRGRRHQAGSHYLPLIGERASLEVLERVPAFRDFSEETARALRELGYVEAASPASL